MPFKDIFDFCRRIDTEAVNKRVVESLIKAGAFDCTGARRSQMMAVYDTELDAAISQRKSNVAGQLSLFDLGADMGMAPQPPRMPPLPEHPPRALLAMEKEVTGIYITGHPLDEHRALLEKMTFSTADLSELEDRPDHGMSLDGQLVEMGGIPVSQPVRWTVFPPAGRLLPDPVLTKRRLFFTMTVGLKELTQKGEILAGPPAFREGPRASGALQTAVNRC